MSIAKIPSTNLATDLIASQFSLFDAEERMLESVIMTTHETAIEPILISKKESARALGVCVRTVENLINTKQLPVRRIGRRTLVPYHALQEFARRDHPTAGEAR